MHPTTPHASPPSGWEIAQAAARDLVREREGAVYSAVLDALVDRARAQLRLLTDAETESRTGLSKKVRLRLEAEGRFPKRVPLTDRNTGYLESEIEQWIEARLSERDEATRRRRSPNPAARRAAA